MNNEPLAKGEWSVLYRFDWIERVGNRDGHDDMTPLEVHQEDNDWTDVPVALESRSHSIGIRYAPFSRITLVAALPYVSKQMKILEFAGGSATGGRYTTRSEGVGDLRLIAVVPFMRKGREGLDFKIGMSVPTGSIDEKDAVNGVVQRLPYDMQQGSGSVDFITGFDYRGSWRHTGWGVQGDVLLHTYDNKHDYRLGDQFKISGWLVQEFTRWLSGSFRLDWSNTQNAKGRPLSGPANNPASYAKLRRGNRVDLGPGISVVLPLLGFQQISLEVLLPVHQNLDGPQLQRDWAFTTGWHWVF
jgi:hypothetical protein